jgi:hypothetical protein
MFEAIEKAGLNGLVTAGAGVGLFGTKATVPTPFMPKCAMPLYAMCFLAGSVASLGSDAFHLFMKEEVPISQKANDAVSTLSSLAINAGLFYGILQIYSPAVARDFGAIKALAVGAGSEWVGSASYAKLKEKSYL